MAPEILDESLPRRSPARRALKVAESSRKQDSRARKVGLEEFATFYSIHFPEVVRMVYLFCGDYDLATDAAQEAFSKALLKWKRLQKQGWAFGWVFTTACNITRTHFTRLGRAREKEEQRRDQLVPSTVSDLVDTRVDLVNALRTMPPKRRQAIVLHYIADYPVAVVADLMSVSEGAVKAHLHLGRQELRRRLVPAFRDPGGDTNG